ncbi:MAG: reverse transcriptase domain-containing protein [Myxococcales bacterium]|nr:reverse transcriptase/maturase family protein [Polyangiaceae bacterium]MDW8250201.1 reverse transcriptase domain-containing protein [Myxococcales bacterium]
MTTLFDLASSVQALSEAFDRASKNRTGPGPDGVTLLAFSRDLDERLQALSDGLRAGTYQPQPGQQILLERPDGRTRRVVRLSVRDRIVHHSLAHVLSVHLDDALHDFAWAYRKGRSGKQGLEQLWAQLQTGSRGWVFRADIEDFFDRLAHPLLLATLATVADEPPLLNLLERLLHAGQFTGSAIVDEPCGAPQGSALSPFLANLVLTSLDRAVEAEGFWMVRYGDDLCIPVPSCHDALRAEVVVRQTLAGLGLSLAEDKVIVASLREGFDFLGFRLDSHGIRPGDRAKNRLVEKLQALLDSRRPDTSEELTALLNGWLAYYGPLDLASLPPEVQPLAESLQGAWAQRRYQELEKDQQEDISVEEPPPDSWSPERLEAERLARQGAFAQAEQVAASVTRSISSEEIPASCPPSPSPRRPLPVMAALATCPRAQELCSGCKVLGALVAQAESGRGLVTSERFLVSDLLGRLGDEAERALDGVFRHLVDYKPGMARRFLGKLFPMPTSCARIRQRLPELAEKVGCHCRFRLEGGVYPNPLLHVLGASEIPGLEDRSRKAALKKSTAKALRDSMNEGRKEMGNKAAALCARLADLRRQERLVRQEQQKIEAQLHELLDEAGDGVLETSAGVLRRSVDEQGNARFFLEV